jgi:predicted methyltransferase
MEPSMKPVLSLALATGLAALAAGLAAPGVAAAHDPAEHAASPTAQAPADVNDAALAAAVAGSWRDPNNARRDAWRHPAQTLGFFGVRPDQTVIEITPGGGWYAEILAPYLRNDGHYVAAVWDDAITGQPGYRYDLNKRLRAKLAGNAVYGKPDVRVFDPMNPSFGPAGSADVVLTFRNAHNWVDEGTADKYFQAFFDVLKPGGVLGLADHRAKPGTDLDTMKKSGYLTEALVIELAQKAGFVLQDRSEINANPKDTADHPNGVWTLPPTNNHAKEDDARYQAIGESDRMTLRFVKPKG